MNRIKQFWGNLRASFWFLPSLIVIGSIVLAMALVELDSIGSDQWQAHWPRLFGAGAEGSRGVLATIAGSMMTVVGITFSMTLMTLALASTQYTSHILRNFMRDRVTQFVLGIFAGVFTYCLIVTRTIRGGEMGGFVPNLAVSVGVILAIGGIGTLIFFIHHIAYSIQASSIIAAVAEETIRAVDRLFPEKLGEESIADNEDPSVPERRWIVIHAAKSGYIQSVDNASLILLARELGTIVRMERGIGEFVIHGTPLVSIALEDSPEKETLADLLAAYNINRSRTVEQDAAFGIGQIVDMALRALSPGINDTTTAGLALGKPLGIVSFSALAVRLGIARLPDGVNWRVLSGAGCLAGIGFTMSLFIAGLALGDNLLDSGKIGALAGSACSAIIGCALLWSFLRKGSHGAASALRIPPWNQENQSLNSHASVQTLFFSKTPISLPI